MTTKFEGILPDAFMNDHDKVWLVSEAMRQFRLRNSQYNNEYDKFIGDSCSEEVEFEGIVYIVTLDLTDKRRHHILETDWHPNMIPPDQSKDTREALLKEHGATIPMFL